MTPGRRGRLRARVVAAVFAVALFAGVGAVYGYWIHRPWRNGNIVMDMHLGTNTLSLIDGSTTWGAAAEGALAEWNRKLPAGTVKFAVVRAPAAAPLCQNLRNDVHWSSTMCGRSYRDHLGEHTGYATTWYDGFGNVIEGDVVFNTPTFAWNSYRGAQRFLASGAPLVDLRRIALHEFGHVLGLGHPFEHGQTVTPSIMNYNMAIETVQYDDEKGIQALYGGAVYNGSFQASGTIQKQFPAATCTWTITYRGTERDSISIRVKESNGAVTGTVRVRGSWDTNAGSSSNPAVWTCNAGSDTFDDSSQVSGTTSVLTWQTFASLGIGTFTGRWFVTQDYVAGTLELPYSAGSGVVRIPVKLDRVK
jgi:hypothetical protein